MHFARRRARWVEVVRVARRRPTLRYHVRRVRDRPVPFKRVWRVIHGRRMRVKLYPPAGSRELVESGTTRITFDRPGYRAER